MSKKTAPKKKNRKLLVQMAIVLISLFVLATLAVSNMVITSSFSTCLMNIEYNCENVLRSFETLSGTMGCSSALVRFWIDHKEDITSYLSTSPDEIDYVFDLINSRFGKYDYTDMTSKEFQSLSEEDQLQIAQVAFYLESMSFSRQLSTRGVDNIQMIYEDEATGEHLKIFDSIDPEINYHPGETVDMDKKLILGYIAGPGEFKVLNNGHFTTASYKTGVTNVGQFAFFGQDMLTAVYLGESVKRIEDRAFESTEMLAAINMPSALE